MGLPLAKPVVSPILVGRSAQLGFLTRAVDEVGYGQGQTILIAGEAGIGKSRLIAEAREYAAGCDFLILEGHCFEPDRSLPYAPLLDLLRARFTTQLPEDVARELGANAPELAKLLPELMALLPGLRLTPPLAPEQEQWRLVQALIQYVTGRAVAQSTIVIVEDLHWSDDSSLEVLLRLARQVASVPLLLLLTYRTDEPHPTLPHILAELDRARLATELVLPRLAQGDVDAMVQAIFGLARPVRAEFLLAIDELCEGNPFFIEEVLTSLVASGDIVHTADGWERKPLELLRIPRTVHDAVRRRSAGLSSEAAQVLALAAVAGRRFDLALLAALVERSDDEVLGLIKELIAAQLVVEAPGGQFAFRHALTRQAIYTELLAHERRVLHTRIVETMERLHAGSLDAHLEDLAYHFHAAENWPKALEYGRRAGERAQALSAPRSAIVHYTRAMEAARHMVGTSPPALVRGRGQAYEILGEFARARDDYEATLRFARAASDPRGEWQALLDLGFLQMGHDYTLAGDYLHHALALARQLDDAAVLAQTLNRLGNWYVNVEQPLTGREYHDEALAIYRALEDRRGIAETLDLLGIASNMRGDLAQSAAYYEQAVVLFEELGDRQDLASSLSVLADRADGYFHDTVAPAVASLAKPIAEAERALAIARAADWRAGEAYALAILGLCLGPRGEFGRALRCLGESLSLAKEIEHREWTVCAFCGLGAVHRDLLAFAQARQYLERALLLAEAIRSPYWIGCAAGFLASTCTADGDLGRAEEVLPALVGHDVDAQTVGQRLRWCARVELALAQGDPHLALRIVDQLVASAPPSSAGQVVPRLWRLRADALAALERPDDAEAGLLAAASVAADSGLRPLLWRIHQSLGAVYQAQARRADAEREFEGGRAVIDELAGELPDESLRTIFLRQANALLPPRRGLSPRQRDRHAFGGLTARERQVASLTAQGASNRAIAEELFISERTVEVHVRNILAKLGFSSRSQIAAWAVERGLTQPTA